MFDSRYPIDQSRNPKSTSRERAEQPVPLLVKVMPKHYDPEEVQAFLEKESGEIDGGASLPEIDYGTDARRILEQDRSPRLWRYMNFSQFVNILETKSLYFPTLLELSHEDVQPRYMQKCPPPCSTGL